MTSTYKNLTTTTALTITHTTIDGSVDLTNATFGPLTLTGTTITGTTPNGTSLSADNLTIKGNLKPACSPITSRSMGGCSAAPPGPGRSLLPEPSD